MRRIVFNSASSRPETIPKTAIKRFVAAFLLCLFLAAQAWGQTLSVSNDTVFVASSGQNHELTDTVTVTATGAWTVTVPAAVSWLTLDKVAGDAGYTMTASEGRNVTLSGSSNGRFTVRALSNGGAEREGTLTIASGGATKTITVMQEWGTVTVAGVKYSRINPNRLFDPYIGVIYNGSNPNGGYWNFDQWVPDPGQYSGNVVVSDTVVYQGRKYIPARVVAKAFYSCRNLTSVQLPNSIESIGDEAFMDCLSLTSVTIPNSLKSIGKNAFMYCRNLTSSITIPNSIKSIADGAFMGCGNLTSVTLPDSLESIGESAFHDCVKLTSVKLPNSLKTIGKYAFWKCETLTSVAIPNSVTNIGWSAFLGCSSLASVILPGSITYLGTTNFVACSSLRTVEVGWDTPINAVWNPGSATYIESLFHTGSAFYGGAGYSGVITFDYANSKLIVPSGTLGLYQSALIWKDFGTIDEATLSTVPDTISFGAGAADTTIVVASNILSWTVAGADWMTITGSPGIDTAAFNLAIAANDSTAREAKLIIASTNTAKLADTIVVIQAANPYINISADSLFFDAYDSQDTTVTVTAYSDWTVEKDTSWIVLGPKSLPPGSATGTFNVRTEDNDSTAREGHITITKGDSVKTIVVVQAANPRLNISADSLFFDAYDSQYSTITVTAYSDWTVVKDTSWIILNPASPSGNKPGTFNVRTEDNDSIVREGHITITKGDSVKTIVVTQAANPYINISADSLFFDASNSQDTTITVTAYTDWTVVKDTSWIILNPASPSGSIHGTFTVRTEDNDSTAREGHITITNGDSVKTIVVTQYANPYINVSADTLFFDAYDSQDTTITVTAYSDWTVEKDTSWIVLGPKSLPPGSATGTFTVRTEDNDSTAREGRITITNGDSIRTIVVVQATNPCLNISADSLFFDAYDSQDTTITITAFSDWTVVKDTSWIILDPASPSGSIHGTFTVRTEDNDSTAREGHITITNGDSVKTIVVTQYANPYINVSADTLFFDAYDSQDTTITVTAYSDWTVEKDTSWIVLGPKSLPPGSATGTFTVRTEDNDSTAREGRITITKGDSVKTIVVTQAANPYINVSADSLFFDAYDSQYTTITVTAYSDWTVVKDTSWIVLGPKSLPPGSATGTFTVRTEDNDSTAREGRITITNGDSIRTIVVVQATNPRLNVSADSLFFDAYDSQDTTITVTAYSDWTVVKDTSWIILNPASPFGNKPGTFTVRTEDNDSTAREGHITITNGDSVRTIVVVQATNPYISVSADSLFFDAYDSQDTTITVTAYSDWTVVKDTSWIVLGPKSLPPGSATGTFTVRAEDNDSIVREGHITITKGDSVKTIVVTQAANPYINVSADSLFFDAYDSQDTTITVTAYSDWTVVKDTSWIILNPASPPYGDIPGTFTVRTEDNDSIVREGHITITKGDSVKTIVVTQAANPYISVSADSLFFDAYDSQYSIVTVTAYSDWTVVKDTSWIILDPASPSGNKPGTFSVRTEDNDSIVREGRITITKGDSIRTIVVVQATNPRLNVSADSLFFDAYDSQYSTVTVTAYSDWTVVRDISWIILNPELPFGNKPGTFSVRTEDNDGIVREGRIIITKGDSIKTIVVVQAANPYISVSTDSLFFDASNAQYSTVTVTAYSDWTVVKNTSWIVLNPASPFGNNPGTFSVKAEDNDSIVREGHITITKGDSVKTIIVTQAASTAFNVPATITFAHNDATPQRVDVAAYTAWSAEKDSVWITLNPVNPFGNKPGNFTVAVAANPGVERTGTITVTKGTTIKKISVTQAANPTFNVPTTPLTFEYNDTTVKRIDVTAYTAWIVEKDSAWITLDPESPSGSESGSFIVTVEENPGVERTDTIIVTNGTTIKKIPVIQAGSRKIVLSEDNLFFGAEDNLEAPVEVEAYVDWTMSVFGGGAWLTVNPASGTGKESFIVTATPNEEQKIRKALIVVANASHSDSIYVTQAALVIDNSLSFEVDGIHYYVPDATVSSEVEVVAPATGSYSGKIVIPSTTSYLGKDYDVTSIGAEVFAGSSIKYLSLPLSLDSVGADAFKACTRLDSLEIKWTSLDDAYPTGVANAFFGVYQDKVTLVVPPGTKSLYKAASFWKIFKIVEVAEIPVGTAKATESVTVRTASGRLYVDSPAAETVYVYSFTGKLLYTATKTTGQAVFDLPAEKLIIVRGSSGWARKTK